MSLLRVLPLLAFCLAAASAEAGPRLDAVKARGMLNCGVAAAEPGMSSVGADGDYRGFEADLCRAVAAAILGEPKVAFHPVTTLAAFLEDEEVDIVIRGLTRSFRREAGSDVRFGPIVFHDGQSFLTRAGSGLRTPADLSGKSICVSSDVYADFLPPLLRHFEEQNFVLSVVGSRTRAESEARFFASECEALTADTSELASALIAHGNAADYTILAEQITKEPLAPLLRRGDEEFFAAVSWAVYALIDAEELGLDGANADAMRPSTRPEVAAFFAPPPPASGLAPDWSHAVLTAVGNYGEIFDRNLGAPAGLARGPNRLWRDGGLLYAPPIR